MNNWISSVQSVEGYMTGYEQPLTRPISEQNIHAVHDSIIPYGGTDQVCRQADKEAENDIQAMQLGGEPFINPVSLLHYWECSHERDGAMIQPQQFIVDAYNRANGLMDPKTGQPLAPKLSTDGDITTKSWVNPNTGAETRIVALSTGTHGWAGSTDHTGDVHFHNLGVPNATLDASDAVLKFLVDHPLVDAAKPVQSAPAESQTIPQTVPPPAPVEAGSGGDRPPVAPAETIEPGKQTAIEMPFEGQKITDLQKGINPRLGCALAVSSALHAQDSRIAVTANVDRLKVELQKLGYEMQVVKPGELKEENLKPQDVILGYREENIGRRHDHMPRHAAIYVGQGKVYQNDSNTGVIGRGDLQQFNQALINKDGKFNSNGFDRVIVLHRPAPTA